ncbi:MAG: hypothetical protein WAL56_00710 [Candidatus Sulfotelmatobacter sp.]
MNHSHKSKRKKNKTKGPPSVRVADTGARCQEHPDTEIPDHINEDSKESKGFLTKLRDDWKLDAAVFVAVLALLGTFSQTYYLRKTMRMDERPWVFDQLIGLKDLPQSGDEIGVDFIMLNTGKTTALQVLAIIRLDKIDFVGSHIYRPPAFVRQYGTIVQGTKTNNEPPVVWQEDTPNGIKHHLLTDADIHDLRTGKAFIQVWGKITYKDSFGLDHWDIFCDYRTFGPVPSDIHSNANILDCVKLNNIDTNF